MDLTYSNTEKGFRAEVRAWMKANVPSAPLPSFDASREGFEAHRAWERRLAEGRWGMVTWPEAYGGRALNLIQWLIFEEEYWRAGAPLRVNQNGIFLLAPTLMEYGTEAQKQRFLPPMASGEEIWAQGWSEPGAGSDMASLRCSAIRDGDHYVINGQKTWSTRAVYADWLFGLFRTDPASQRHHGLSFILLPLNLPGISIRPIKQLNGQPGFAEIFFDDVRVPAENLIGEENKGWTYAKFLLGNERVGVAPVGTTKRWLADAKEAAGDRLSSDPVLASRVAELENELLALELTALRVVAHSAEGKPHPASSVLKLRGTELQQAVTELYVDLAGPWALASGAGEESSAPDWARVSTTQYLNFRKASIYGGSNEVQRQIISGTILGL